MNQLSTGQFFGQTNRIIELNGITLTDTEYTHDKVDWHYHDNAYFTFILQGNVTEGNRKETYNCSGGSLIFHNWQDPHYNIKPEGYTRGFHIEILPGWFDKLSFNIDSLHGSYIISNPDIKFLFYRIFNESKVASALSQVAIEDLLLKIFSFMLRMDEKRSRSKPEWVEKVTEILNDDHSEPLCLEHLSKSLGIHPVHLSRDFPKYFQCNIGDYIRKLKIERSMSLLSNKELSLTEIAYICGFSDQSHFIRCFKKINYMKPFPFRKILLS